MQTGFVIDKLDYSVLTQRSLKEIAGDQGSDEWQSNRKAAVRKGAEWLLEDDNKPAKTAVRKSTKSKSTKTVRKTSSIKKKSRRAA